jgi:hypothetical protein
MRITRRAEALIYLAAFLLGFASIPLGVWWR